MDIQTALVGILDEVLGLKGRVAGFTAETQLLGAIPELDSMAVVAIITTVEEHFGVFVEDEEITGEDFATVGTLVSFVERLHGPASGR